MSAITLPGDTGQHVVTETEYGLVLPDGSVQWSTLSIQGREYAIKDLTQERTQAQREWPGELKRRAKLANINPYDYSNMHKIITRQVVLAVTAAQDHRTLRPWPAPDPGPRPAPVEQDDDLDGLDVEEPKPKPPLYNPWG